MRISTSWIQESGINGILRQQSKLSNVQNSISTGKRINHPSDDPVGSARAISIEQDLSAISDYKNNANLARSKLEQEESALSSFNEILQKIREKAIYANNGALSINERNAIAAEMSQRLSELYNIANTQDANGNYIFSGFLGTTPTVTKDASGQYIYQGDEGLRYTKLSTSIEVPMNDNGNRLFFDIDTADLTLNSTADDNNTGTGVVSTFYVESLPPIVPESYVVIFNADNPGTNFSIYDSDDLLNPITGYEAVDYIEGQEYTINGVKFSLTGSPLENDQFTLSITQKDSQNVFNGIANLIASITNPTFSADRLNYNIAVALQNLDKAEVNILTVRAEVGARLNTVDSQLSANSEYEILSRAVLSQIQDLDLTSAITQLELLSVSLEAAQRSFIRIRDLSIFNYL